MVQQNDSFRGFLIYITYIGLNKTFGFSMGFGGIQRMGP